MFGFSKKKKVEEEYVEKPIDFSDTRDQLRLLVESNKDLLISDRFNWLIKGLSDVKSREFILDEHISSVSRIGAHRYNKPWSDYSKELEYEFNKKKESHIKFIKEQLADLINCPELVIKSYLNMLEEISARLVCGLFENSPDINTFTRKINTINTGSITTLENLLIRAGVEGVKRINKSMSNNDE